MAFGHGDGDRFDKVPQPISTTVPWNRCKKSSMIASNVISVILLIMGMMEMVIEMFMVKY